MKHVDPSAKMSARQVRRREKLPQDGREAADRLERLEKVLRETMRPDVPTFDVNSVQGADFAEWTYTEGLGFLLVSTQSVEINARLIDEAAAWPGTPEVDYAGQMASSLTDKWRLDAGNGLSTGSKVFFPPGGNFGWIVNTDNVLRAFGLDPAWLLKPHPVTSDDDVREAKRTFGVMRILHRDTSGMRALRSAEVVGYTTASEMGLVAMAAGKPVVDFTKFEFEHRGRYYPFYRAIRQSPEDPRAVLNRILNCPWSGAVHLDMDNEEAGKRFRLYKEKSLELRASFRPLVPLAQGPIPSPQPPS
ncbi:MAG: hypothetical protein OXT71_05455 [Acidobacteriota bacterium]|nr:hypothetical protein [Acidobacteriota bacterium]